MPQLPRETFLRILLFDVLPLSLERVIWLDTDTVAASPPAELSELPFGEAALLAVPDYSALSLSRMAGTTKTYPQYGLDPDLPYLNCGVLVVHLQRWRDRKMGERILEYTRNLDKIAFGDQDGVNIVAARQWSPLDLKWNVQVGTIRAMSRLPADRFRPDAFEQRATISSDPGIVHFSADKPWVGGLRNPFAKYYYLNLKRSAALTLPKYWLTRGKYFWRGIHWYTRCKWNEGVARLTPP